MIKHGRIFLFVILIVFLSIFITDKNCEKFSDFMNDNRKKIGFHSVVDIYTSETPSAYDLNFEGPKCLSTCVMEHIPNINWSNPNKYKERYKEYIEEPSQKEYDEEMSEHP